MATNRYPTLSADEAQRVTELQEQQKAVATVIEMLTQQSAKADDEIAAVLAGLSPLWILTGNQPEGVSENEFREDLDRMVKDRYALVRYSRPPQPRRFFGPRDPTGDVVLILPNDDAASLARMVLGNFRYWQISHREAAVWSARFGGPFPWAPS